jgi:hypothetical protein
VRPFFVVLDAGPPARYTRFGCHPHATPSILLSPASAGFSLSVEGQLVPRRRRAAAGELCPAYFNDTGDLSLQGLA